MHTLNNTQFNRYNKGICPTTYFFLKSGNHGFMNFWNNNDFPKYVTKERENITWRFFCFIFYLEFMSLPRKIMEQYRLCPKYYGAMQTLPRKTMEPSFFAPQNYGAFILCPCKIMDQCRLCPTKSQQHSFRGQVNYIFFSFFSFCK